MSEENNINLSVPIYLDTETLLDLMATLEDGFRTNSKFSSNNNTSNDSNTSKEGNIGFGFNFFNIGGKISHNKNSLNSNDKSEEYTKYHTYGSLMNMLIEKLREKNILKEDNISFNDLHESDFVLLNGKLEPNPIVDFLKNLHNIMDFSFKTDIIIKNDVENGYNMVESFSQEFENDNYQKYLLNIKEFDFNAFIYIFNVYIRDRVGVELPFGTYNVLGKIVRKIDSNEEINWKDGTVFGNIKLNFLEEFFNGLTSVNGFDNVFDLENIDSTEIKGDIIQIIPIAIFI